MKAIRMKEILLMDYLEEKENLNLIQGRVSKEILKMEN